MADTFDVVVIGSGPGGYVAAIRAAQLGLRVACIEKSATLGGTCLNVGCIPSKALLHASELYHLAQSGLPSFGVKVTGVSLDLPAMMAHKTKTVTANTKGIEFLFKKNKVTAIHGAARFTSPTSLEVALNAGGTQTVTASAFIIATGSEVAGLPGVKVDEKRVVSSTGALELSAVPKHLIVIGGGVIGLEMGSVWRRLGAQVTVIEYLDRITPGMDGEVAKAFQRVLAKQGFEFHLSTKVVGVKSDAKGVSVEIEPAAGGDRSRIEGDIVLMAIGRKPHTEGLGLDVAGVALDSRGRIETDAHFRTNVPGIFAIGDVIAGAMLAHKAEDEGVAVAEILVGQAGHVNHDTIPGVVYTNPEVASVGKTEEELKAAGIAFAVGKFPFSANGRAKAMLETEGFVKILADATTDRVLGVHIIGPGAGTLIAEAVLAMEFGASAEDIARTCHAHPTLNEVMKEAALAVDKRPIHI